MSAWSPQTTLETAADGLKSTRKFARLITFQLLFRQRRSAFRWLCASWVYGLDDSVGVVHDGAARGEWIKLVLRISLRTKILIAVLAAVIATDALGTWAVNDRLLAGARQEADQQAQAQMAQTRALYAERAATLAAEGEAVSLYPAVIAALVDGNPKPLLQWSGQVASRQGTRVSPGCRSPPPIQCGSSRSWP